MKRNEPPLTPTTSFDDTSTQREVSKQGDEKVSEAVDKDIDEPPKKKRRVALTRVGDLDS